MDLKELKWKRQGDFLFARHDRWEIRMWRVEEKWNARVVSCECIHAFSRDADPRVALKEAYDKCLAKEKLIARLVEV